MLAPMKANTIKPKTSKHEPAKYAVLNLTLQNLIHLILAPLNMTQSLADSINSKLIHTDAKTTSKELFCHFFMDISTVANIN